MSELATRVLAVPDEIYKERGRNICVQVGLHRMEKIAEMHLVRGCQIVTADELATVLCEYIDGKLARQSNG